MKHHQRILVAVDNSEFSSDILRAVSVRGWERKSEIKIVSVVQPAIEADLTDQCVKHCQLVLKDRVDAMVKALPYCHIEAECIEGQPGAAVVSAALEWDADLIVIGSHGDTGPRSSHLGSVAAAIVNAAPCSVAVVKLKKHTTAKSDLVHSSVNAN